jgi:hypothetical protein
MTHLSSLGVALTLLALTASPAPAQWAPWCLYESSSRNGAVTCTFHTFEQCLATRSGIGGSCGRNPYLSRNTPYTDERRTGQRKRY